MNMSKRQQVIVHTLRGRHNLSTKALLAHLSEAGYSISEDSLARDIARLKTMAFLQSEGQGPARRHSVTAKGRLLSPLDMVMFDEFLSGPRPPVLYDQYVVNGLFSVPLFDQTETIELAKMQKIFTDFMAKVDAKTRERWYQKWLIEFAWKSSAIEGNTYSVLETETLLIDHIEATGKSHAEAQMILNHQTAVRFADNNLALFLSPKTSVIEHIHALLVEDLDVASGLRKHAVGISGSVYKPLANHNRIKEELNWLLSQASMLQDPWSKALSLLIGLSYLQAFADGNKRTARVVANGVLRAHGMPPLIFATINPTSYRRACLAFYELGSLDPLKQAALESWQQTVNQLT